MGPRPRFRSPFATGLALVALLTSSACVATSQAQADRFPPDASGRYAIGHTTIQVEVQGCDADALYCTMTPVGAHDHHGHHH